LGKPHITIFAAIVAIGGVAQADPVSLHGSTTVVSVIFVPHKAEIEKLSGQQLDIVGNGSQRGLDDLVNHKTQIAMISAPLDSEVTKLNDIHPGAVDRSRLQSYAVGALRVSFVVHPSNTVKSLTEPQLADLLSGRIKNWKVVGGADQPVVVVAAQPGDGVRTTVENTLLKGASLSADTRAMPNITQVVKVVAQLPGALGAIAASSLDNSVIELQGAPTIRLTLALVTMDEPTPAIRQVIDAIKKIAGAP
jgi:phosphate transport system substrate-binding protein